ncbi:MULTISPECIES: MFS transporter [unclassified Sphingomonas]|uniref:MFS transporter n=1 Tax=unclassified Sphingomonas TaxID=196159 RepID=UPI0006FE20BD|nr:MULTISPECIES: MFS transporter [unclassified Sphingomonas]KQX23317.1 MFS transporter [Sphingomonas sp. Root1294]KQY68165.1 MFS transporter [Sphingomonas sp. Root50]KRB91058.1 MFS transporter [Sphingomonas sp. Root720]
MTAARTFWICFAVAMLDGFDTLVVSFIAPAFASEWGLGEAQVGRIFAAGLVGAAAGAIGGGVLVDRIGPRRTLLGCIALFGLLTLGCAMAPDMGTLTLLRFLAGLGLGGAIPAISALAAATVGAERRSATVTRMFLGFPLGAVLGGMTVAAMIGPFGWRSALWLGGLLALLLVPIVWARIEDVRPRSHLPEAAGPVREPVLGGGRRIAGLSLFAGAFLILLVGYFLISWAPTILVRAGATPERAIVGAVLLNVGGIVGALALTRLLDRLGPFRVAGLTLLAGAAFTVALGARLPSAVVATPLLVLAGATVIGAQLTLPSLAASLFPSAARGRGVGLTMGVGRLGSIAGPLIGGEMLEADLSDQVLFACIAVPVLLSGLALRFAHARRPAG